MIELTITQKFREGYKVVVPSALKPKLKLLPYVENCVYVDPSQIKTGDRLCFVDWVNANEMDRFKWKNYYDY